MTNSEQIKHLSWRASFGLSPSESESLKNASLSQFLDHLFSGINFDLNVFDTPPLAKNADEEEEKVVRQLQKKNLNEQKAAWIGRMANPDENALLERMSLFWHGHFACISRTPQLAIKQLNSIRQHALGSFRTMLYSIAQDPAMIRFLNNQQNRKKSPNENFARELLELFTIGRGNYTEIDVKEAARAFTGWSSNGQGEFVFRKSTHDEGTKKFFGKTGDFNGNDILDLILEQKQTALFITRKIYCYFVNPKVDEKRVYELAKSFYSSNYNIGKLMRSIFESNWFYSPENIGVKIKSPIDLIAGMMRTLEISFSNPKILLRLQRLLGQELFNPPNVAGWKGDKNWIDHATLMVRLNLANHFMALAQKGKSDYKEEAVNQMMEEVEKQHFSKKGKAYLQFEPVLELLKEMDSNAIFLELSDFLLQTPSKMAQSEIEKYVLKDTRSQYIQSLLLRLMSLPEYQLC